MVRCLVFLIVFGGVVLCVVVADFDVSDAEFGVSDSLVSVGEYPSLTVSRGLETDDG